MHSLGLEEEIVERIQVHIARSGGSRQEGSPLPVDKMTTNYYNCTQTGHIQYFHLQGMDKFCGWLIQFNTYTQYSGTPV